MDRARGARGPLRRRHPLTRVRSTSQTFGCPGVDGTRSCVVLGFSRVLWLQFFTRQTMQHVFEGLEAAFSFFGGVPHELLFDQMKAVVTKDERDAGGRIS